MGLTAFDFDKTLTRTDTVFGFYRIMDQKSTTFHLKRLIFIFAAIGTKIGAWDNSFLKRIGVRLFLKGKSEQEIERGASEYANSISLNSIYQNEFLRVPKKNRVIISASFIEYLKYIFPDENLYASRLAYADQKVIGLDINLYGQTKKDVLLSGGINSIEELYTDSFSDRPLMEISEKIFLIKGEMKSLITLQK
jgi:phosphoserine phosphatase